MSGLCTGRRYQRIKDGKVVILRKVNRQGGINRQGWVKLAWQASGRITIKGLGYFCREFAPVKD